MNVKSIKTSTKTYNTTSVEDTIFNEAVKNFEDSVESFSKYNVNIIADKKYITDTINFVPVHTLCMKISKIILPTLHLMGIITLFLVCGAVSEFTLGVTSKGTI